MKGNLMTIIKKELARFFGDKRMAFTTILMPGLMIFILYNFMGSSLMSQFTADEDYVYQVYADNLPDSIEQSITAMDEVKVNIMDGTGMSESDKKAAVTDKEVDLYAVFPTGFEADVLVYDSMTASGSAPQVGLYYNSASTESSELYQMMVSILDYYESAMANRFDVNAGEGTYDLATNEDSSGRFFAMMVPMLLMIFLFSGCMAVATEAIAGEKERGTIATLLVTPMKRSHLALGKIISLSVIGLLSGASSFIGTMLSLPTLMGAGSEGMDISVYGVEDYAVLLMVILTTVLVMVGAMAVLSALAKSIKEASTMVMPLMIVVMVVALTSMVGGGAPEAPYWYLIPFYNSVQSMNGIFLFDYNVVNIVVTLVSNLAYTLLLTGFLTKLFDSEKIMYS